MQENLLLIKIDLEAILLLNQYAFKKEILVKCFEKLSWKAVNHAKDFPFSPEIVGFFLA